MFMYVIVYTPKLVWAYHWYGCIQREVLGWMFFFFLKAMRFFAGDVESKNPSTFGKTVYFMMAFTYYNLYTSKPTIYIYAYIYIEIVGL
jgi:hypothetical protein